ncbi:hypothetical protein ABZ801_41015 [Actinomadura sp. NPDC047616]|uniref:hypothetical protein n=1 Tax=Actinomadura sp. NPDC047616 TaxID=3155914 RepID=UPI0033C3055F
MSVAVYVAGLLGALLTAGSLSDHLGRRPVLVAALLVAAAVIGSVIAGLGAGLTVNGPLRLISAATGAEARPEVFSTAYVISCTALGAPCPTAGLPARWWGLEPTARFSIAFIAVLSVIVAAHAGRPQAHKRTDDGRSATSAPGSPHHVRPERTSW